MNRFSLYSLILLSVLFNCKQTKKQLVVLEANPSLHLENGVLFFEDYFFDGLVEDYYESGTLKSKTNYSNGRKDGEELYWYANNAKATQRYYLKGLKVDVHKGWWQNGKPKFVYCFNKKGEYHGAIKEWYKTGDLFRYFNYVNGKEVGSQKLWYENKKIKANYKVINGERFGLIGLKKCYPVRFQNNTKQE